MRKSKLLLPSTAASHRHTVTQPRCGERRPAETMDTMAPMFAVLVLGAGVAGDHGAAHSDVRCKCVCPNPEIINATSPQAETRRIYIKNVAPRCVSLSPLMTHSHK